ncbi:hypothetical protein MKW94_000425, partial [Papaver nudicaule]|nr:hypothetical protein [Papaver nudicaule]
MAKTRSSNSKTRLAANPKKRSAMETSPSSSPSPAAKKPVLLIPKQSQSPPPSTPPPPPGLTLLLKKSPSTPPGFEKKPPPVPLKSSSLSSALCPQLNLLYDQIFTALPQVPHFNPLSKYSENIREGIKQGYDIAFVKLVERFQNFADPATFLAEVEDLNREFKEFEEVGYDLTKVKERFNLLKLRAEQEKEWKDV